VKTARNILAAKELTCNSYTGTSNDWRPLCHNYHSRHYL